MTPRPIKVAFDDICNYQGRTIITAGTIYTAITIFGGTIDGEYRQGLMFEKERFGFSYITLWIKANADPGPNEMAIAPDNWNRIDLEIHTYNNEIIWPRHLPEAEQPVGIQARVLPPFSGSKGCELILEELWKSPP